MQRTLRRVAAALTGSLALSTPAGAADPVQMVGNQDACRHLASPAPFVEPPWLDLTASQ